MAFVCVLIKTPHSLRHGVKQQHSVLSRETRNSTDTCNSFSDFKGKKCTQRLGQPNFINFSGDTIIVGINPPIVSPEQIPRGKVLMC